MRIILIDPSLINFVGHSIEFVQSLTKYARFQGWKYVVVSNKRAGRPVRNAFSNNLFPLVSSTCFEDLVMGRDKFLGDLEQINHEVHFAEEDIVIILTSYTNEISATNLYLKNLNRKSGPRFYFWVHQLFPPENNFMIASQEGRKKYWLDRFKKECSELTDEIHIYSTPSQNLQQKLQEIINKKVGILPLPFGNNFVETEGSDDHINSSRSVAFLGDGRYEKGALLFLRAVEQLQNLNAKFLIQRAKLRGFPEVELTAFNSLIEKLEGKKSVSIINDDLPQQVFRDVIKKTDVLIFPYHPKNYDMRVSGLLVQGLRIGKPAIVSSGTWLGEEVNKFNSGIVFEYDTESQEKIINNLSRSIERMLESLEYYKQNAMDASPIYRKTHSAEKFFEVIFSEYEKSNSSNPNI